MDPSAQGHLGGFRFLAIVSKAALNICARAVVRTYGPFLLVIRLGAESLGRMVTPCLTI